MNEGLLDIVMPQIHVYGLYIMLQDIYSVNKVKFILTDDKLCIFVAEIKTGL